MTPRPEPSPAASLDDRGITDLLADLRERAATGAADPHEVEPAIAELEAEAARRGLELPAVREVIPPALAFSRFEAALARDATFVAGEALGSCDASGLWRAYRRVRAHAHAGLRIFLLRRILFCVEWGVYGEARARQRFHRLSHATQLNDDEYEAYLVQCLDALFTVSIVNLELPY
jgi:hypothetical protein